MTPTENDKYIKQIFMFLGNKFIRNLHFLFAALLLFVSKPQAANHLKDITILIDSGIWNDITIKADFPLLHLDNLIKMP
jgi:hypothetical protein